MIFIIRTKLKGQATSHTCWKAAGEMLIAHHGIEVEDGRLQFGLVRIENRANGVTSKDIKAFCTGYGLSQVAIPSKGSDWKPQMILGLLAAYGPFALGADLGGHFPHMMVVTGIDTMKGRVYLNDPSPEKKGSLKYMDFNKTFIPAMKHENRLVAVYAGEGSNTKPVASKFGHPTIKTKFQYSTNTGGHKELRVKDLIFNKFAPQLVGMK